MYISEEIIIKSDGNRMVDDLDREILHMLQADGSTSFTKIAKKLRRNESTIRKRVLSLKKDGVIKKFSVVLDPAKIGFGTVAVIGVDIDPEKLLDVAQNLIKIPETRYVATSTGDHMIMIEIWAKDGRELSQILSERIGAIEGVKKICPSIILEKMKE